MAQITVYAQSDGNWDEALNWDTNPAGGGDAYTDPQNGGGNTFICDLNGKAITQNKDVVIDKLQEDTANGTLTPDASRSLTVSNGGVTYSGTSTSGMIIVPTGVTLTINSGTVTNSSTGYAIVTAGTASLTISNTGGTAISASNGRAVQVGSTGTINVYGKIYISAGGYGVYTNAAATVLLSNSGDTALESAASAWGYPAYFNTLNTASIVGDINSESSVSLSCNSGIITWDGTSISECSSTTLPRQVQIAGSATLKWIGSRTIGADKLLTISLGASGSSLILADSTSALNCTNDGSIFIYHYAGTITLSDTGGSASIVENNEDAGTILASSAYNLSDLVTKYGAGGGGLLQPNKRGHKQ